MPEIDTMEGAALLISDGVELYREIQSRFTVVKSALQDSADGTQQRITIPWDLVFTARSRLEEFREKLCLSDVVPHRVLNKMRNLIRLLNVILAKPEAFQRRLEDVMDDQMSTTSEDVKTKSNAGKSLIMRDVMVGDDVFTIANSYGASWREIVAINKLTFPFVNGNVNSIGPPDPPTGRWVAYAGDTIKIPVTTSRGTSPEQTGALASMEGHHGQAEEPESALFGRDLKWDSEELAIGIDPSDGGCAVAEGLDNLKQVVEIAITLQFFSLKMAPYVGSFFARQKGTWAGVGTSRLLAHAAKKDILSDPRIIGISKMTMDYKAGQSLIYVMAEALGGTAFGPVTVK